MNVDQLHHFKTITLAYFGKLAAEEAPQLEEAYLHFADPVPLDYTSMVRISGECDGCIYLSADTATLEGLLALHGEEEITPRTRMDMCRELSNVLAGNAMHAFGDQWQISVPTSLNAEEFAALQLPPSTFVMPIVWRLGRSHLVIGLNPSQPS